MFVLSIQMQEENVEKNTVESLSHGLSLLSYRKIIFTVTHNAIDKMSSFCVLLAILLMVFSSMVPTNIFHSVIQSRIVWHRINI